jgi:hypothetical protein
MLGSSLAGEASIVYSQLDYLNALYKLRRRLCQLELRLPMSGTLRTDVPGIDI